MNQNRSPAPDLGPADPIGARRRHRRSARDGLGGTGRCGNPADACGLLSALDFVMQPGQGCAFAVAGVPTSGFEASTVFDDSYWMRSFRVKGYYENLDNHKTYWVNDTWSELDVYDATTNILTITASGQLDVPFWPGDVARSVAW